VKGLDAPQIRVLGCLLEKQQTTPDAYPLTLNSLRLACNQSTSRDPVVAYDEATVREAAQRLGQRGLSRMASYHGSRAPKYRHLVDESVGLPPDERALITVLMLRGPQTLGELKQRTEKLHQFSDLASVREALDRLTGRELGRWLERRPGQKEARYTHLLLDEDAPPTAPRDVAEPVADAPPAEAPAPAQAGADGLSAEVARLREEVDALRREFDSLREELNA
jgi:uncharacterized protein